MLQFTHDPSGLVFDWVSELSWEVNREFLDYLDQNHNIDVNPSSGEFTFDLECNADQGNNGEYYSEISTTRVRVTRIYDSDELTKNEIGIIGEMMSVIELTTHSHYFSRLHVWRPGGAADPLNSGAPDLRQVDRAVVLH